MSNDPNEMEFVFGAHFNSQYINELYDGDYAVSYSQELGRPVEDRNCFKVAKGHAFAGFRLDKNRLESFLVFRPVEARFNGVYYKVNPKNLFFPEPGDDV